MSTPNVAVLLKPSNDVYKKAGTPTQQLQEARRYLTARQKDERKCALLQKKNIK